MQAPEKPCRVLMVRHSRHWKPDRCSQWLACQGCDLEYVCPAQGDELPDASNFDAAIFFGGMQSANDCDKFSWMGQELNWIEQYLKTRQPLLGICLGAQLIAKVLGARIGPQLEQEQELGFGAIYPSAQDADFIEPGQLMFQWHSEGFEIPHGARQLACGKVFPNQAYSYDDHVTGLQFHPEANRDVIECWIEANKKRLKEKQLLESLTRQLQKASQLDATISIWIDGFMNNWLGAGHAKSNY